MAWSGSGEDRIVSGQRGAWDDSYPQMIRFLESRDGSDFLLMASSVGT